jgi:predicted enzyme related to lactoylglutathione lyase
MAGRFDQVDLRVPDLGAVHEFYRRLLPNLGFEEEMLIPGWLQYRAPGKGAPEFFGVTESPLHASNQNRIAFRASGTSQVDSIARLLHEIGAKNIEGPAYEASQSYYVVFFEDPAGNRFEVCYRLED